MTSQEQLALLLKSLDDPWGVDEELRKIGIAKWGDRNQADQLRYLSFSFTQDEFQNWIKGIDLGRIASSEEGLTDSLYVTHNDEGSQVYLQERGFKDFIAKDVSVEEARLAAFKYYFDGTTGGYISKLFGK